MSIVIPDDILQAARMTAEELRQELAILLFQKEKLTLEQASRFAMMGRVDCDRHYARVLQLAEE